MSTRDPGTPDEQSWGLLFAVVLLRGAVLVWASVVVLIDLTGSTGVRGPIALGILAGLAAWTTVWARWVQQRSAVVTRAWTGCLDVALAAMVAGADHFVYPGPHPQSFGSAWPMSAAVLAGIVHGARAGGVAGAVIGSTAALGTAVFADGGLDGRWTATVGSLVLLVVSGVLAGLVTSALRRAEATEARAAAREEVARRLHDGVLQTLAAVQRRSDDPDLVTLARDQELDLRGFIAEVPPGGTDRPSLGRSAERPVGDLVGALRETLAVAERRTGVRAELVVVEVPDRVANTVVLALCGATTEALTNAEKHGRATSAVICVDLDDRGGLICTIKDDGEGFDPSATPEGTGLSRSIRGRVEDVGGSVEVVSRPGRGCEVRLAVP